jgi:hypothetical protein
MNMDMDQDWVAKNGIIDMIPKKKKQSPRSSLVTLKTTGGRPAFKRHIGISGCNPEAGLNHS